MIRWLGARRVIRWLHAHRHDLTLPIILFVTLVITTSVDRRFDQQQLRLSCQVVEASITQIEALAVVAERQELTIHALGRAIGIPLHPVEELVLVVPVLPPECEER